jgi:glycosyltransferase involved in cell wall biosynthesis
MKRILFIADHRPDRSPGQRFRCEQYFDVLRSRGFECDLSYVLNAADDAVFYRPGHWMRKAWVVCKSFLVRQRDWRRRKNYDVIFIFRNCVLTGSLYFEKRWAKSGIPIVFDFDDAIWKNDTSEANRLFAWLKKPEKIQFTIAASACVLAGNDFLKSYALQFNPNVMRIPSTIDTERYRSVTKVQTDEVLTIGWSGSITTIKHFNSAIPALLAIKEKYRDKVRFVVIGDPLYRHPDLGIIGQAWNAETEPEDLTGMDIGIMPLPNDEWTRGKCGLKGLQYMAMGIPTIMSPVGVNTEIIQHGVNGFLADTTEDWVSFLSALIDDGDLRKRLGEAASITVEERYSKNAWKDSYVDVFDNL